jgi:hypothetical protein
MFKFSPSWADWWCDISETLLQNMMSLEEVLKELHYTESDFTRDFVMGKTAFQVAQEIRRDYQIKMEEEDGSQENTR